MHGPKQAALFAAAVCLALVNPSHSQAGTEAISRARALLAKGDAKAAVTLLEDALPGAGADLGPTIVVLRQAYVRAAEQAASAGKADEAAGYRENLEILNRRMRARPDDAKPAPTPGSEPPQTPTPKAAPLATTEPRPALTPPPSIQPLPALPQLEATPEPLPTPDPAAMLASPTPTDVVPPIASRPDPLSPPTVLPRATQADEPVTPRPTARSEPLEDRRPKDVEPASAAPAGPSSKEILIAADRAYLAGKYLDANRGYAALAKAGQLPAGRKDHWAYCRSVDVLRRLKAKPTTAEEWASIDREIGEIKALNPTFWWAEYLRNLADDSSRSAARTPKGRIVRGASPESDLTSPGSSTSQPQRTPSKQGKPGALVAAAPSGSGGASTGRDDSTLPYLTESANFRIHHADAALADSIARAAEATRESQARHWSGSMPRNWSPKCEIDVYPTAVVFAAETKQAADSPGFSTMTSDGNAISGRRIRLRADHPDLLTAILPHEVTHVVLADLFPAQPVPRWADEGIAVLAEPQAEQERRLAELDRALQGGKVFTIESLMVRDCPEGEFWPLYYAQSISLTRFLVSQGKPAQFIDFLHRSQSGAIEGELRKVYGIEGYADLQKRWLDHAKARVASTRQ
jgi:hypothetical protein